MEILSPNKDVLSTMEFSLIPKNLIFLLENVLSKVLKAEYEFLTFI